MKSKIFLCLLLIVAMLAFVGCSDNGTTGTLEDDARNMVDDAADSIDRVTDDIMDNTTARDAHIDDNYRNDDPILDGMDSIDNTSRTSVSSAH